MRGELPSKQLLHPGRLVDLPGLRSLAGVPGKRKGGTREAKLWPGFTQKWELCYVYTG